MADKYTFKDADDGSDFKDRQITLVKTISQSEVFSIKQFDINQNVYEIIYNGYPETIKKNFAAQNIMLEYIDQKWIEIQAKIDAATTKLG